MKKEKTYLTKRDIRKALQDESIKIYSDDTRYNYGQEIGFISKAYREILLGLVDCNCFRSNNLNSFFDRDATYTLVRA